jgi:LysM repeat protein
MQQYEQGILRSTSSAGPKDYAGFTLDFLFTNATFTKLGGRPILSIDSSQNETNLPSKSEACTIRETLEEMKTGGKMVGPNGTHYVTSPGDSFWSIAKKFYGNGKYHLLVSGQNEIGTAQMNHLVVGKTLQLDSLARLQKRDDLALVMKGESLWKIAKRPSHKDFNILRANNAGWVADTNKIYPLQSIRTVPVQKPKKP